MIDANGLKTFKISNGALKGETLPQRLKFFAWGDNKSTDGNFRAGEKTSAELSANQKKLGFERVAIDFNHCSVPGTDTYKDLLAQGQPPLIFGYGRVNPIPGDGLYLEDIIWTPLGVQHARNFEDLSPAIQDEDGEVTLVHSVALTPNGKVEGLEFFTAQVVAPVGNEPKDNTIPAVKDGLGSKTLTLLSVADMLGLPETAEEKTVLETLSQRLKGPDARQDTRVGVAAETITTLNARVEALEKKLADGIKTEQDAERLRMVTLLSAEGKSPRHADGVAYSREELLSLDVPTLKLLHANTPVTVPLAARGMTSQIDGQRFVSRDSQGNVTVDLAGIFNSENQRNGQAGPRVT
jgi:Mu-like prophage I protein